MKQSRIKFTSEGFAKIKADYDALIAKRPEAIARLKTAREMGDLSENGAYKAARFEVSGIDRELRRLSYLLKVGRVTESVNTGFISFGNTVTLNDGTNDMVFTLVEGFESNPAESKLSVHSPIGRAIVNKRVGDRVVVHAPAGEKTYTITAIE